MKTPLHVGRLLRCRCGTSTLGELVPCWRSTQLCHAALRECNLKAPACASFLTHVIIALVVRSRLLVALGAGHGRCAALLGRPRARRAQTPSPPAL
jgi:hypothetical protein